MITSEHEKKEIHSPKTFSLYLLLSSIILVSALSGYLYYQYQKVYPKSINKANSDAPSIVAAVEKLMLLPVGETPTVATVTDITKLNDQPFFKNAVNGNKVLIFSSSKLAIIYDLKRNIIINVGPVNIPTQQVQKTKVSIPNITKASNSTSNRE